jgi:hypothetical protein
LQNQSIAVKTLEQTDFENQVNEISLSNDEILDIKVHVLFLLSNLFISYSKMQANEEEAPVMKEIDNRYEPEKLELLGIIDKVLFVSVDCYFVIFIFTSLKKNLLMSYISPSKKK